MDRTEYSDLTVPQLRRMISDRGISFGMARTQAELIALLEEDDRVQPRPQPNRPARLPVARELFPSQVEPPMPPLEEPEFDRTPVRFNKIITDATGTFTQLIPTRARIPIVPDFDEPASPPQPLNKDLLKVMTGGDQLHPAPALAPAPILIQQLKPIPDPIPEPIPEPTPCPPRTTLRKPIRPIFTTPATPATPVKPAVRQPIKPIFGTAIATIKPVEPVKPVETPPGTIGQLRPTGRQPIRPIFTGGLAPMPTSPMAPSVSIGAKLARADFELYDTVYKQMINYPAATDLTDPQTMARALLTYQYYVSPTHGDRCEVMGFLMNQPPQFIADLISILGFNGLSDRIDVYYNLLWYLNVAKNPLALGLTPTEKAYISSLNPDQLLDLLGTRYTRQSRPRDRASLIFAFLSGKSAPIAPELTRYEEMVRIRPNQVWRLALNMYNIVSPELELVSLYPPYLHVAQHPPSDPETVILAVTLGNLEELIRQYGIVWAEGTVTDRNKLQYFSQEIAKYDRVFSRGLDLPPLPELENINRTVGLNLTNIYTLRELVEGYEPIGTWRSREELIDLIMAEGAAAPMWSYRTRHPNNETTLNPVYHELHRDIDKSNPLDPTISYGRQRNYRCYQVSELTGAFSFDADGFMRFSVPDYQIPNPTLGIEPVMDPTTGRPLLPEFPLPSIRQLQTLLRHPPPGYHVSPLLHQIDLGLAAATAAKLLGQKLRREYLVKTEAEQYLIRLYLAWLFTVGMWQRFWAGPGHPWPVAWIENGGVADRVDFRTGEEHGFIQNSVHTTIIETYENSQYPGFKEWIEAFPIVDYNFQTQEVRLATGSVLPGSSGVYQEATLKSILDESKLGLFCTAHSSRLLLGTSYFLIEAILNLSSEAQINQFLEEMLPALDKAELDVVNFQLEHFTDPSAAPNRYQVLIDRQTVLTGHQASREAGLTPYIQPPFQAREVTHTGHTDPELGRQLQFTT